MSALDATEKAPPTGATASGPRSADRSPYFSGPLLGVGPDAPNLTLVALRTTGELNQNSREAPLSAAYREPVELSTVTRAHTRRGCAARHEGEISMDDRSQAHAALSPSRPVAFVRRVASPIWRLVGIAAVLEVPGRRTGTPFRVTLIPVKIDGATYVLSFGGVTNWALNLRSTGRGRLLHRGRTHAFNAIEVDGNERDRVIAKYLSGSGPVRKDFNRRPDPADHPTFRLEPIS